MRAKVLPRGLGGKFFHLGRGHGFAAHGPVAALDFLDDHPGDGAHVLPFDGDHRVGDLADHLALLRLGEDPFNQLDLNHGHGCLLVNSALVPIECHVLATRITFTRYYGRGSINLAPSSKNFVRFSCWRTIILKRANRSEWRSPSAGRPPTASSAPCLRHIQRYNKELGQCALEEDT